MSAYGAITRLASTETLPTTLWEVPSKNIQSTDPTDKDTLTIHHLTLGSASQPALAGLIQYLHRTFAAEVEQGQTYPQETFPGEPMTQAAFEAYFFAADVFVAITASVPNPNSLNTEGANSNHDGTVVTVPTGVDEARAGRSWEECVGGFYYIKPNYPGRSSHICNAGFVVPPAQRSRGYATALAKSYLHYGPKLGYHASVFNLVYANNVASLRIWEKLGFAKVGRIPKAGRLRRRDGEGEEYVDAWIIYKSFLD